MANSKLENKTFVIPDHVIKTVKPGTMRSDFVIRRKNNMSYYNVKRLKHFFDNQSEDDPKTYNALGEDLKKWVETVLGVNRDVLNKGKRIKSDIGMLNVFKKAHTKDKSKGSLQIRIPKPSTNARQIFTGKGLYENNNIEVFKITDDDIREELSFFLSEEQINKYSLIIESPLYNNVQDIISDIMFYENKFKKNKK